MNNSSLLTADRATHLKIVVISLVCAVLIAAIGIASRITETAANGGFEPTITKPAKPITAAAGENRTIR
jgi:ABC-type proline/glycine betaine transport system permease subunit